MVGVHRFTSESRRGARVGCFPSFPVLFSADDREGFTCESNRPKHHPLEPTSSRSPVRDGLAIPVVYSHRFRSGSAVLAAHAPCERVLSCAGGLGPRVGPWARAPFREVPAVAGLPRGPRWAHI